MIFQHTKTVLAVVKSAIVKLGSPNPQQRSLRLESLRVIVRPIITSDCRSPHTLRSLTMPSKVRYPGCRSPAGSSQLI